MTEPSEQGAGREARRSRSGDGDRPERAVAVILREGRLLMIERYRHGRSYAVLPGGGIEPGETAEEAVLRELVEETGLTGVIAERLWVRSDGGRRATYFLIENVIGSPVLGGPERLQAGPSNRYSFAWADQDDLDRAALQPAELRPLLVGVLDSAPRCPTAP